MMLRKILKMMKWFSLFILSLIILIVVVIFIIRRVNVNKTKITTDKGIQESNYVEINGNEHYLQIRGENRDNPVILFLHGGPGFPLTYLSTYFQQDLEKQYTFVNYEQRHAGRTYYKNDTTEEVSFGIMLEDVHGVVNYVKNRLQVDKVIIMGQSWGTVLGSTYVQKHPENVTAYFGVGQVIDFDQGKILAAEQAMALADQEDSDKLEHAIAQFKKSHNTQQTDIVNLENLIMTSAKYLKGDKEISGLKQMWLGISSPYMTIQDIQWFLNASNTQKIMALQQNVINYMYYEFNVNNLNAHYDVPMFYIQGSHDYITPTQLVEAYYATISTPVKNMYIMEDAGHTPFLDKPNEFAEFVRDAIESIH
ncbi:alpha/beta hydrolase [Vallitalea pronyensis]|uniref:Alpha/beta hydrolase n=1 Tax=Vallitalea pronyensis TaxID=1348613 RepID=A0A8J8MM89_9FIRM|nr:alpha/beta hydrolase [Vallitalea pronyensis]QUI24064.1 alpha/beta hydrolase [Vallitalea pronyensis]